MNLCGRRCGIRRLRLLGGLCGPLGILVHLLLLDILMIDLSKRIGILSRICGIVLGKLALELVIIGIGCQILELPCDAPLLRLLTSAAHSTSSVRQRLLKGSTNHSLTIHH